MDMHAAAAGAALVAVNQAEDHKAAVSDILQIVDGVRT